MATIACWGCKFCGCSSGNYFLGSLPFFNKHFVGVRYSYKHFSTRMETDQTKYSKDFYTTPAVWMGASLNKHVQLLACIPYGMVHAVSDNGIVNDQGLGDVSIV